VVGEGGKSGCHDSTPKHDFRPCREGRGEGERESDNALIKSPLREKGKEETGGKGNMSVGFPRERKEWSHLRRGEEAVGHRGGGGGVEHAALRGREKIIIQKRKGRRRKD